MTVECLVYPAIEESQVCQDRLVLKDLEEEGGAQDLKASQ